MLIFKLNKEVYNINRAQTHKFERHMLFSNQTDRDDMYQLLSHYV